MTFHDLRKFLLSFIFCFIFFHSGNAQDVDFHISKIFLPGKNILKAKRDFGDPYLWVLAENNGVYRINSITNVSEDYTAKFSVYQAFEFIDIAGYNKDSVYIATNSTTAIAYEAGSTSYVLKNIKNAVN